MALVKTNIYGYYKDEESGVIINKNEDEYKHYLAQKALHREHLKTLREVNELKREMEEIKQLLLDRKSKDV